MPENMTLVSPDQRSVVRIDPARGGRVASISVDGRQLLVARRDDPLAWGCYPMVPFAGRIRDGELRFDGVTTTLGSTDQPHAMHGYGFTSPWARIDDATIRYAFGHPWPYAGVATQHFVLENDRFEIEMTIEAHDRQPVNVGWHPWFRRDIGLDTPLELIFAPGVMYERDDHGLPSGRKVAPSPGPWDDCFTALEGSPILRWGTFELTLVSTVDHWVVYDETDHAVCVEPQMGPPNDANDAPHVLDAGDRLSIGFTLVW